MRYFFTQPPTVVSLSPYSRATSAIDRFDSTMKVGNLVTKRGLVFRVFSCQFLPSFPDRTLFGPQSGRRGGTPLSVLVAGFWDSSPRIMLGVSLIALYQYPRVRTSSRQAQGAVETGTCYPHWCMPVCLASTAAGGRDSARHGLSLRAAETGQMEPTRNAWVALAAWFRRRGAKWCWCPRSSPPTCATTTTSTPRPTGSTQKCLPAFRFCIPKGCTARTRLARRTISNGRSTAPRGASPHRRDGPPRCAARNPAGVDCSAPPRSFPSGGLGVPVLLVDMAGESGAGEGDDGAEDVAELFGQPVVSVFLPPCRPFRLPDSVVAVEHFI